MDINLLVKLCSRAWCLPVLAKLHEGVPGRQAALIHAIGAGRTAFRQSMDHLIALGMVERNPGHGHPLRPEFRLTVAGSVFARVAHRLEIIAQTDDSRLLLRRSWTLPVLAVTGAPTRFAEIGRTLSPITDRALSQSLLRLEEVDWVQRRVETEARPARVFYQAQGHGQAINEALAA